MTGVETDTLDTLHRVETPEGVDLVLRVAGPLPRLFAWLVDLAVRGVMLLVAGVALSLLGKAGMGLMLILTFCLEWLYPILFEVLYDGATPGKRLMGLRVLRYDGTPIDWTSSAIRNLLRVADFLPFFNIAGLMAMLFCGEFRRLGDLAAGTLVAYRGNIETSRDLPLVRPEPPPLALELAEQRALVSFAHRGPHLSRARAEELASLTEPLFSLSTTDAEVQPVSRLYGIAAWLLGRRPETQREGRQ